MRNWISVSERLPTVDDAPKSKGYTVIAQHKATNRMVFHWETVADNPFDFIAWMPLPDPPKAGDTD